MSLHKVTPELSKIICEPTIDDEGNLGYRNTAILFHLLKMIRRGDSKETILDVYYFLSSYPEPQQEKP